MWKPILSLSVTMLVIGLGCGDGELPADQRRSAVPGTGAGAEGALPSPAAVARAVPKQYSAPPPLAIDPNKKYTATIEMEKGGEIVIELFPKEAPNAVNSFVFLARAGFYDGITFHRVIPGFMAQGGDPTGTGTGGAGYRFDNEFSTNRRHDAPGVLSMANSGIRNGRGTNGSQFFITYIATPALDGLKTDGSPKDCAAPRVSCHTVFGKVVEGQDVADGITPRDPAAATTPGDAIRTIRIEESS